MCSYRDRRHRRVSAKFYLSSTIASLTLTSFSFCFPVTVVCPSSKPGWTFRQIVQITLVTEQLLKAAEKPLKADSFSLLTVKKMLPVDAFHYNTLDVLGDRLLSSLRYWVWQVVVMCVSHTLSELRKTASISAVGGGTEWWNINKSLLRQPCADRLSAKTERIDQMTWRNPFKLERLYVRFLKLMSLQSKIRGRAQFGES